METAAGTSKTDNIIRVVENRNESKESLKKMIDTVVKNALDQEMQKATQEILEEQKKAIRQIVDEYKSVLRQIVDEEKKNIWEKAEELRKSILKLGL